MDRIKAALVAILGWGATITASIKEIDWLELFAGVSSILLTLAITANWLIKAYGVHLDNKRKKLKLKDDERSSNEQSL